MKVYQILATVIVGDSIDNSRISELCRENIQTAIMKDFYISNCITYFDLKETIDYPDPPINENDQDGKFYDEWMQKSQEIIEQIKIEIRNP